MKLLHDLSTLDGRDRLLLTRLATAWPSTTSGPPIEGTQPKSRVTILQWESIEQLNAYRKSAAFVDARKIGDKYAKFRTFAIEGMPQ